MEYTDLVGQIVRLEARISDWESAHQSMKEHAEYLKLELQLATMIIAQVERLLPIPCDQDFYRRVKDWLLLHPIKSLDRYEVRWRKWLWPIDCEEIHLGFSDQESGGSVAEMARNSSVYKSGYLVIVDLEHECERKQKFLGKMTEIL